VRQGKVPITLGGEHTVTFGPVRALAEAGHRFGVVQFDAHADLRDRYHDDPLSHACVMRRIHDLGIPAFAIGVRSLSAAEHAFRLRAGLHHLDAEALAAGGYPDPLLPDDFPREIYVTFDVDAFDPSLMPSTGTPEPGGLHWYQAIHGLHHALAGRRLLAADVVELAPQPGQHAPDFTAAKLVYALMGMAAT
jgi:agmatinase